MKNSKRFFYIIFRCNRVKRAKNLAKLQAASARRKEYRLFQLEKTLEKHEYAFGYYLVEWQNNPESHEVFARAIFDDDILGMFVEELLGGHKPDIKAYEELVSRQYALVRALEKKDKRAYDKALADGADPKLVFAYDHGFEIGDEWHTCIAIKDLEGQAKALGLEYPPKW